ncbi:hypothetical protein MTO96_031572 [Rhipicephalus appendiculatus]
MEQVATRQRRQPKPLANGARGCRKLPSALRQGAAHRRAAGSAAEVKSVAANRLSTRGCSSREKPALQCRGASIVRRLLLLLYGRLEKDDRATQRKRARLIGACVSTRSLQSGGLPVAGCGNPARRRTSSARLLKNVLVSV